MKFQAKGHNLIKGTHKTTLEFTKEKELTESGDCIIGVSSNFNLKQLKEFIKNNEKARIILKTNNLEEQLTCKVNKNFNDNKELVIRKSDFLSERTFGIRASKGSNELSRHFIKQLKNHNSTVTVSIETFK